MIFLKQFNAETTHNQREARKPDQCRGNAGPKSGPKPQSGQQPRKNQKHRQRRNDIPEGIPGVVGNFSTGWFSRCSQINASTVTSGSAAIRAPSRSLRLASSVTSTTTPAVTAYLMTIHYI